MKSRYAKIGYFDLYSGPGAYEDGTESTPLQIMRIVLADERLKKIMVTVFEDKNPGAVDSLSKALASLDGIDALAYKPMISRGERVRRDIQQVFAAQAVIPILMFLDPFGYVGLTRDLIRAILKDRGCDVLFYLNFNRITGALRHPNPKITAHMDALFGEQRVSEMSSALAGRLDEPERERVVLSGTQQALKEIGAEYVLPFAFRTANGRLDHHLVFATKNLNPAQKIMKGIMSRASSRVDSDGVGSFEFDPAAVDEQPQLIEGERKLDDLKRDLCRMFEGKKLRVVEVYESHERAAETPFTMTNYQNALRELAYVDRVIVVTKGSLTLPESSIRKKYMSEDYDVQFLCRKAEA